MAKNIVVTPDNDIYYFEDKKLYEFLNEEGDFAPLEGDDKNNWEVLSEFPLPDSEGAYCPFSAFSTSLGRDIWPANSLIILRDGQIFVPEKRTVTKTVTRYEYAPKTWSRKPRKAAAKKLGRPKKSVKAPSKK